MSAPAVTAAEAYVVAAGMVLLTDPSENESGVALIVPIKYVLRGVGKEDEKPAIGNVQCEAVGGTERWFGVISSDPEGNGYCGNGTMRFMSGLSGG